MTLPAQPARGLSAHARLRLLALLAVALALPAALLSLGGGPAQAAPAGPVLVVVAHPDDEALGMAGVIANATAAGRQVYVAVVTNGDQGGATNTTDRYCATTTDATSGAAKLGLRRDGETIAAMGRLGLRWSTIEDASDIFFLGYPDSKTTAVANSAATITTDASGLRRTFAKAGDGSTADSCNGDFGYLLTGQHSPLNRAAFATDMDRLLAFTDPTDIYTHSTFEGHGDHREVARQTIAAVIRSHRNVAVHGTLIHPEGIDSCTDAPFLWPNPISSPSSDPDARFTPALDFSAPPIPKCSYSPTSSSWGPAGAPTSTPTVPASMQDTSKATNLKWKVLQDYTSQLNCQPPSPNWHFSCGYFQAFVKRDEIFWDQRFGVGLPLSYENTLALDAGLDSLWRFGDGSGTVATATHGTNPGTYSGVTLGAPGLLADDPDTAADFSGSADVAVGDVYDFAGTAPFTLEAWVNPATVDGTSRRIFSKESADGLDGYALFNSSSQLLKFSRLQNGATITLTAPAALQAGVSSHVVVTYDGAEERLFVDGVQQAVTSTTAPLADTAAAFTIGAKASGGGNWSGTIDEPAVYTAALSPATIMRHYLAGIDAAGEPDSIAPGKPGTPTAAAQDEVAHVALATLNDEADLASYTLQRKRSADPGSAWSAVATGVTTWPATDTGLVNGTSYDYRALAVDASGNSSAPSDPVSVTPVDTIAPAKPATPAATALDGAARVTLSPLNGESDIASYALERRLRFDASSPWTAVASGIAGWPVTDTGLTNGAVYDYRVIAFDTSGHASAPSDSVSATPAPAPTPLTELVPPAPVLDSAAPTVSLSTGKVQSARYVRRAGLRVRVRSSEACTIRIRLVLDAASARRAGLALRLIATRTTTLSAAGDTVVVLKLSSSARKRVTGRGGSLSATVSVRVTDAAGNRTTQSRRIVLR